MTYIDPRAKTLAHRDRIVAWDRGETPAPVTIEWDLSNRCVLGCQDCHFAHTHVRGPWATKSRTLPMAFESTGDVADTTVTVRALAEARLAGVQSVVWTGGGEPTTHPDWMHIVGVAHAYGVKQGMYTCGTLLGDVSGPWLADRAEWVVVSLDAADAETYSTEKGVPQSRFEAACDGVVALVGHKATIGVSFLLHEHNWQRCSDMLALARTLGADYTTFRPAIKTQTSTCVDDRRWITTALDPRYRTVLQAVAEEPDVEISLDRFREYASWQGHGYDTCYGIQLNTTITPDGRMWLCPQRRGVSLLGDLRAESFESIWRRHPRSFAVTGDCRALCRLHPVNQTLASLRTHRQHEAFI